MSPYMGLSEKAVIHAIHRSGTILTHTHTDFWSIPIGSMYGIYANIWGILMVNVTIYGIHTDPMGLLTIILNIY